MIMAWGRSSARTVIIQYWRALASFSFAHFQSSMPSLLFETP
jgi:hypothetical protein